MRFVPTLRFFRRDAASRQEQDPADMGTAFGLDACLEGGSSEYCSKQRYELLESEIARPAHESPLAWLSRRTG